MESKNPLYSKTMWMSFIFGVLGLVGAFVPSVKDMLGDGGSNVLMVSGLVFGVLRMVSKGKISIE